MIPFVSIVVPMKNEAKRLPSLISALEGLDYPRDRYEIIVADNGSSDATPPSLGDARRSSYVSNRRAVLTRLATRPRVSLGGRFWRSLTVIACLNLIG